MMNLFNILDTIGGEDEFCGELAPVLRIVGIVIWGIKVVVPILLIIMGMLDMARAVTEKSEEKIRSAQTLLIKRAITAVIVFLVATIVTVLMKVIGSEDYKECMKCIDNPWSCSAR